MMPCWGNQDCPREVVAGRIIQREAVEGPEEGKLIDWWPSTSGVARPRYQGGGHLCGSVRRWEAGKAEGRLLGRRPRSPRARVSRGQLAPGCGLSLSRAFRGCAWRPRSATWDWKLKLRFRRPRRDATGRDATSYIVTLSGAFRRGDTAYYHQ